MDIVSLRTIIVNRAPHLDNGDSETLITKGTA